MGLIFAEFMISLKSQKQQNTAKNRHYYKTPLRDFIAKIGLSENIKHHLNEIFAKISQRKKFPI